jgi:hypothetical protein
VPTAYLDTPIISEADKRLQGQASQITQQELEALRAVLKNGTLIVRPSLVVLDEVLGELESDRAAMVRKLRLVRELLGGFHGMLNQPSALLRDTIRAYAEGQPAPAITLLEGDRRAIVATLSEVCAGSTRFDDSLRQIRNDVGELKDAALAGMEGAQAETLAELQWASRDPDERRNLTFEVFWNAGAERFAGDFADALGHGEGCRHHGLEGLLELRPVRFWVGTALSLMCVQVVGVDQTQVRLPHRNDGYDLWHAVLGSTADVFVTFDRRLAGHVEAVPGVPGFRVVRSVKDLLA